MHAIETRGEIDKNGNLLIKKPLSVKDKRVKVIVLFEDEEKSKPEDQLWLESVVKNPSFEFLKEEPDIYSLTDGKPFND